MSTTAPSSRSGPAPGAPRRASRRAPGPARRRGAPARRGAAIAAIISLLAVMNITLIAGFRAGSDQSEIATLRIETERAFYAAESGAVLLIGELLRSGEVPDMGATVAIGSQTVEYAVVPEDVAGVYEILGQSGRGHRRISIEIE